MTLAATEVMDRLSAYLGASDLTPTATTIGSAEPTVTGDLPAIVLSLHDLRLKGSVGGQSDAVRGGALAIASVIDLENPVLSTDPSVGLLDPARTALTLPHGGLVRETGEQGALGPSDLGATVDGMPVTIADSEPEVGKVTFAAPLPSTGQLQVSYFIGQWQRSVTHLEGQLLLDLCVAQSSDADALRTSVLGALFEGDLRGQVGSLELQLASLSSLGLVELDAANCRRQRLKLTFRFEHVVDRPESSGSIIQRVATVTKIPIVQVDADGEIIELPPEEETG